MRIIKKSILLLMLLIPFLTESFGQGLTKDDKQVIAETFIALDECDSVAKANEFTMADMRITIADQGSKIIVLEDENQGFKTIKVPALEAKVVGYQKKVDRLERKIKEKGFWSVTKDVFIVALAMELAHQALK